MSVSLQRSAFLEAIQRHEPSSVAVVENASGASFSYQTLLQSVARAKEQFLLKTGRTDETISGERVAFLVENGFDYVGRCCVVCMNLVCCMHSISSLSGANGNMQ